MQTTMQTLFKSQTADHIIAGPNSIESLGEQLQLLGTRIQSV
jgi:alcohol dehydrogenase